MAKRLSTAITTLAAIARGHTAPPRLAAAVLLGCIVGCSPFIGLHLPLCLLGAWLGGLNPVVVYSAANISIPPLIPVLGFSSVQLGERLLHGRWLPVTRQLFRTLPVRTLVARFFFDWLVGGLVVGAALGLAGGALLWLVAARMRQQQPTTLTVALEQASQRYRNAPPRFRWYAHFKYRLDPVYRVVAGLIPPGAFTVDLGSGLGMLPLLLGLLGEGRRALGVEWDQAKLRSGQLAVAALGAIELVGGDLRTVALPACDVVTFIDVLHYYDRETQGALLDRAVAALRPGGRLLVRDGDGQRGGGARLTRLIEWAATRCGWNRGPQVHFRGAAELTSELRARGCVVRSEEVAGPLHPGNVLLIAELA